jgi:hypothetical protein
MSFWELDNIEPQKEVKKESKPKVPKIIKPIIEEPIISEESISEPEVSEYMALVELVNNGDVARGLALTAGLEVKHKNETKEKLKLRLKKQLETPQGLGIFLERLAKYLQSI